MRGLDGLMRGGVASGCRLRMQMVRGERGMKHDVGVPTPAPMRPTPTLALGYPGFCDKIATHTLSTEARDDLYPIIHTVMQRFTHSLIHSLIHSPTSLTFVSAPGIGLIAHFLSLTRPRRRHLHLDAVVQSPIVQHPMAQSLFPLFTSWLHIILNSRLHITSHHTTSAS